MPYMKVVIDALVEKGVRQDYVVLVGGAPLNEAFQEWIAGTPARETGRTRRLRFQAAPQAATNAESPRCCSVPQLSARSSRRRPAARRR
jgi:hypothetical protein